MHSITNTLRTHIAEGGKLVRCIAITRSDHRVIRLSDSIEPVTIDDHVYAPCPAAANHQRQHHNASSDSAFLETIFDDDLISKDDVMIGLFDRASIDIYTVAPELPSEPPVIIFSGHIGSIHYDRDILKADLVSIGDLRHGTITSRYSPYCRATFGDTSCAIDAQAYAFHGIIAEQGSASLMALVSYPTDSASFAYGYITIESGANKGFSTSIITIDAAGVHLRDTPPFTYAQDDRITLIPGCDKRFTTCVSRYHNAVNFRGEPHLPGAGALS